MIRLRRLLGGAFNMSELTTPDTSQNAPVDQPVVVDASTAQAVPADSSAAPVDSAAPAADGTGNAPDGQSGDWVGPVPVDPAVTLPSEDGTVVTADPTVPGIPVLSPAASHGELDALLAKGEKITSEILDEIEKRSSVGDLKYLVAFLRQLIDSQPAVHNDQPLAGESVNAQPDSTVGA